MYDSKESIYSRSRLRQDTPRSHGQIRICSRLKTGLADGCRSALAMVRTGHSREMCTVDFEGSRQVSQRRPMPLQMPGSSQPMVGQCSP